MAKIAAVKAARPRPMVAGDDRGRFDCGRDSLNAWFERRAWRDQSDGLARVTVLTTSSGPRLIGYVSLRATQIEAPSAPDGRERSRFHRVPALLLSQLAVDLDYQRQGHAADLVQYVLRAALQVSETMGCAGVLTRPLDEELRLFFWQFGFEELSVAGPPAMFVRLADIRQVFG